MNRSGKPIKTSVFARFFNPRPRGGTADATDLKSIRTAAILSENQGEIDDRPSELRNPCANDTPKPPDLAEVVEAWPGLPFDVQKSICGVVRATMKARSRKG